VYQKQRQYAEAAKSLQRAIQLDPAKANARQALGHSLMSQKQWDAAAVQFEHAVRLDSSDRESRYQLGVTMVHRGKLDEAADHFAQMLKADPDNARLHFQLGVIAQRRGESAAAAAAYQEALRRDPRSAALNNLAWLRATSSDPAQRDGAQAVELALTLHKQRGPTAEVLDTLAAAYAEAGDFTHAVTTAQSALKLAEQRGEMSLTEELRNRLALYRQNKPYHEPSLANSPTSRPP
jgi:tetratricopeptide (TPR) repeat protein